MRHGPSLKAITLLRKTPGMEIDVAGVRQLSELGQSILTTARCLPRGKADRLIRYIMKKIPADVQVPGPVRVKMLRAVRDEFEVHEALAGRIAANAMKVASMAADIRRRFNRIKPGDEVGPNMIAVKSPTGDENERRDSVKSTREIGSDETKGRDDGYQNDS